jgi:hypothetical protein
MVSVSQGRAEYARRPRAGLVLIPWGDKESEFALGANG